MTLDLTHRVRRDMNALDARIDATVTNIYRKPRATHDATVDLLQRLRDDGVPVIYYAVRAPDVSWVRIDGHKATSGSGLNAALHEWVMNRLRANRAATPAAEGAA